MPQSNSSAPVAHQEPFRMCPLAVRVREACRLTGIGRSKLYLLIQEGHIETRKIGSMTLIPMSSLQKLLDVQ